MQKILSELTFTMMIVMALVTTAMTGPLYYFIWLRHLPLNERMTRAQSQHSLHQADSFLTHGLSTKELHEHPSTNVDSLLSGGIYAGAFAKSADLAFVVSAV